jgi:hypothetical protein
VAQITGGSVTFGRTVQPAQYESKKAEVTITFACSEDDKPEDAHAMLDGASAMAKTKALELLGLKATEAVAPAAGKRASAAEPIGEAPAKPEKAKPGPKPKAQEAKPAEETIDLGERDKAAENVNEAAEASAADADADLLGPAPAQPITDKDLMDAVTKKMAEINDPKALKEVRGKFVQAPLGFKDIPQEKRAECIAAIKALVKK